MVKLQLAVGKIYVQFSLFFTKKENWLQSIGAGKLLYGFAHL